jgi:hypothetical protein
MVHKLVKIAYSKDMLQFEREAGQKPVWASCSSQVKAFTKNNFKEGDEVDFTYTENKGVITVTRVSRPGQSAPVQQAPAATPALSQPAQPAPKQEQPAYTPKKEYTPATQYANKSSPEYQEGMKRGNVLNVVAAMMQTQTGQLNINDLMPVAKRLYVEIYDMVSADVEKVRQELNA